eukprot:2164798-Pleurochrysis_carterae.AAC.1
MSSSSIKLLRLDERKADGSTLRYGQSTIRPSSSPRNTFRGVVLTTSMVCLTWRKRDLPRKCAELRITPMSDAPDVLFNPYPNMSQCVVIFMTSELKSTFAANVRARARTMATTTRLKVGDVVLAALELFGGENALSR